MGQMMLFTRYDFMHDAKAYQQKLVDFAIRSKHGTTLEEVETARRFYEEYVAVWSLVVVRHSVTTRVQHGCLRSCPCVSKGM